jgi:hypothetical protein
LRGWPALQAWLVDRIKRAALRELHATEAGEVLVLRAYLIGEEATELALQRDLAGTYPDRLQRQVACHLADEQHHADLFAVALAKRGVWRPAHRPDFLSRWKIAQWRSLAQRYIPQFSMGAVVPAFIIGLCAEQMASRVLQRHCELIGARHPLYPLLSRVLVDEQRHVGLCGRTLARLVAPHEQAALAAMLDEARKVERSFGVTGALAMYAAGVWLRIRARFA